LSVAELLAGGHTYVRVGTTGKARSCV